MSYSGSPKTFFFLRYVIRGFDLNVQYTEETKENIFWYCADRASQYNLTN